MNRPRRSALALAAALIAGGGSLLAEQAWLESKAVAARWLIARSWQAHLRDGGVHRPWPHADLHPLAILSVPRLGLRRTVLAGATGATLAFGPGHVHGTARPNADNGRCVIAGHRDSWFAFLGDLRSGDTLWLTTRDGRRRWTVRRRQVVADDDLSVLEPTGPPRLVLLTCWPLRSLRPSRRRLILILEPDATPAPRTGR